MKIEAFVILDARHVDFEVHNNASLDEIKKMAIRFADEQEGSWEPEVQNIEIIRKKGDYSRAISTVKAIDIHKLKCQVFDHFIRVLDLDFEERESFARHCELHKKGGE